MHRVPSEADGRALRVGVGARASKLARSDARRCGHERSAALRHARGAGPWAHVHVRTMAGRAPSRRSVEDGARRICAEDAGLLPLLPEPSAKLTGSASLRRGYEGAARAFKADHSTRWLDRALADVACRWAVVL